MNKILVLLSLLLFTLGGEPSRKQIINWQKNYGKFHLVI